MEWIGFIFLICTSIYLFIAGYAVILVTNGFTGKFSCFGLFLIISSIAVLYVSWLYKPFTILVT